VKNMRGYKVLNEGNHIHIQTIDGCWLWLMQNNMK
jgi:hypothetical protein